MYLSNAVDALDSPGAAGELTADEALGRLLSGTGLTYRYLDDDDQWLKTELRTKAQEIAFWTEQG